MREGRGESEGWKEGRRKNKGQWGDIKKRQRQERARRPPKERVSTDGKEKCLRTKGKQEVNSQQDPCVHRMPCARCQAKREGHLGQFSLHSDSILPIPKLSSSTKPFREL